MTSTNTEPSAINQILDRAYEQNPQAGNLLKAFGPIIIRQRQLAAAATLKSVDYSGLERTKLKAGIPVIQQINLLGRDEDLKSITLSLAEAVKEGLPALKEGMDKFCDLIAEDKIHPADYFQPMAQKGNGTSDFKSAALEISPSNASFLMSLVSRVVLEQRAKEAIAVLGEFDWEKGYCPICGEFPSIALIEEQGGRRFLHCSGCGHEWRFTRVICPYCENEAQKGMDYFYIENKTQESAFVCDKCRKYLVTLYRVGSLFARDLDVSAVSLVHLDMIMQDKGYAPMTSCPWNILN